MYFFRVSAINEVGESAWTEWSSGFATRAVEPEAPSAPEALSVQPQGVKIRWAPPFACGFPILRYDVRVSQDDPSMERAVFIKGKEEAADEAAPGGPRREYPPT